MKIFKVLTMITILLLSCAEKEQSESTDTTERVPVQPKNANKIIEPDSLNEKNTAVFLKEYGSQLQSDKVRIKTRLGNITVKLYEETPLHKANFLFLSNIGYFNTTCFYRVVPDFIIQGGNSENLSTIGMRNKYHNYRVPAEIVPTLKHKYGAVAAARDWENNPNKLSNSFEFYIVQNKEGAHHLDGEHTVFGQVIDGFSVIDRIAALKTGQDEWPLDDVFMEIEVLN